MKKSLYMLVAALSIVACNKNELEKVDSANDGKLNLGVSVEVDQKDTKLHFDGKDHIAFDNNESLIVGIAKEDSPEKSVKVATKDGALAESYSAEFEIEDATATNPVFKGTLWSIVEADIAKRYVLYSACPASAFTFASNLTSCTVTVPNAQKTTQSSWGSEANALISEPILIDTTGRVITKWKEYNVPGNVSVSLAHVFGFGKLTFAGVPDKYADYKVNTVEIKAVGEKKDIAGTFYIDMTKDIQKQEITTKSSYSSIEVTPSESVSVKDAVIWFEANPGTYDVEITIKTDRAELVYERQGLVIERRSIAAPVVNYKGTDVIKSFDVDLTGGKEWAQAKFGYDYIYSGVKEWGPEGSKMKFALAWPGSTRYNYGTSYYRSDDSKAQGFNGGGYVDGGKMLLYSLASFKGVDVIYANLGIYSKNSSCDFTFALANGADTTKLKTISITTADVQNADGLYYTIENTTEVKDGDLLLIIDNLSSPAVTPYMGGITINPAPIVTIDLDGDLLLPATATSGKISCTVKFASASSISAVSDAEWLTVSLANNELTYSALANDGKKRTANIEVKNGETVLKTIKVTQKTSSQKEYKLVIDPTTIAPILDKAKAEHAGEVTDDTTVDDLEFTLTATATDGTGDKVDVKLIAKRVYLVYSETSFKMKYTLGTAESVGYIEKVVVVGNNKIGTVTWDNKVELSSDGSTYNTAKNVTVEGSIPYTNTILNEDESFTWFRLNVDYMAYRVNSIEVLFVNE